MFVVRVHVGPQINCPDGEMVDTQVLGTCDVSRVGSSPTWGTIDILIKRYIFIITWTLQCVI